MQVVAFSDLEELAPYAPHWDRLAAGNPFRGWAWASTWWRYYGDRGNGAGQLCVLGVRDERGRWVGLAPWYIEPSAIWGHVLKFLGSNEVCSEYLGLLAEAGEEEAVADAVADWLHAAREPADRWDMAELRSVDAEDVATRLLIKALCQRKLVVDCRPGPSCWRIDLPPTWHDYYSVLSSSRRKRIRQTENRLINSGRVRVHVVRAAADLALAQEVLIDLHQRRRRSLGEPGCFAAIRCQNFHREVMRKLLVRNRLLLYWLSIDERPVAAEYALLGAKVVYAYQGGIAPESLHLEPGHLSHLIGIRHAIDEGYRAFDFLRGDEPYKADWRASPRPTLEYRVAAPRLTGRARLALWRAGSRAKRRLKALLRPGSDMPALAAVHVPTQPADRLEPPPPTETAAVAMPDWVGDGDMPPPVEPCLDQTHAVLH